MANNDFNKWLNGEDKDNNESINEDSRDIKNESRDKLSNENNESKDNNLENESLIEDFLNDKIYSDEDIEKDSNEDKNFERDSYYQKVFSDYADKSYVDAQIRKYRPKFTFLKAVALVLVGTVLGAFVSPYATSLLRGKDTSKNSNNTNQAVTINTSETPNVENAVAKKAIPSVVGIRVKKVGQEGFMGRPVIGEGIGSGVIVSEDGYILTNAHVVGDRPSEISVLFSDNTTEQAKIIWKDESLDLAVIKVEKKGLQKVEIADSDKINIGDKAIAIGNPFGLNLQSTLTSGYISGLNRAITMQNGQVMNGLIQTDASINSGNSGGALLNSKGQLIGINTAKANNSDGIGFAIPSNVAKSIVDAIIKDGNFNPVTLGVRGIDLANYKQFYADNSVKADSGVFISEVIQGSAAHKGGIRARDIIVKIKDTKIESMNKLKQELIKYHPGDKVKFTVIRNNKEVNLEIQFENNVPNL